MKNLIIILLTAAVTLLLVNLYEGWIPLTAHAGGSIIDGNGYIDCATSSDLRRAMSSIETAILLAH